MPNAFRPGDNQTQDYNQMWQTAPAALPDQEKQFWKTAANMGTKLLFLNQGLYPEQSMGFSNNIPRPVSPSGSQWQAAVDGKVVEDHSGVIPPPHRSYEIGAGDRASDHPYDIAKREGRNMEQVPMSQMYGKRYYDHPNEPLYKNEPNTSHNPPTGHLEEMEAINQAYHNAKKRIQSADRSSMKELNREPTDMERMQSTDRSSASVPVPELYGRGFDPKALERENGSPYGEKPFSSMGPLEKVNEVSGYLNPGRMGIDAISKMFQRNERGTNKVAGMDPYKYEPGIGGAGNQPDPNSPSPMGPSQIAQINSSTPTAPSMPTGGPLSGNPNAKPKIQQATELNEKKLELEDAKIQAYKMAHNQKTMQDAEMFEIKKAQELMELAQGNGTLGTMEIISIG